MILRGVIKTNIYSDKVKKELNFSFLHQCSRINFFYCAQSVFSILKFEYLGKNKTKNENILTHWSAAQAGSNDEKNWRSKILLDCPFNTTG